MIFVVCRLKSEENCCEIAIGANASDNKSSSFVKAKRKVVVITVENPSRFKICESESEIENGLVRFRFGFGLLFSEIRSNRSIV